MGLSLGFRASRPLVGTKRDNAERVPKHSTEYFQHEPLTRTWLQNPHLPRQSKLYSSGILAGSGLVLDCCIGWPSRASAFQGLGQVMVWVCVWALTLGSGLVGLGLGWV